MRRPQTTSRKAARRPQCSQVGLEPQDLLALCISLDTLTGSAFTIQHLQQYAMRILRDFQGLEVRLTEERLEHILEHPEMSDREAAGVEVMARDRVRIWYDVEGDYLEVLFDERPGYFRETANDQGNVLGFSAQKVSAIRTQPLDVAL